MQQLTLIADTKQNDKLGYLLETPSLSWVKALEIANDLEKKVDNSLIYQSLLGVNTRDFYTILDNKGPMYRLAVKAIWWHRKVCTEKPLRWFTQKDMSEHTFFTSLSFMEYSRKQHKYILNNDKLHQAQLHWSLVKKKYPYCKKNELKDYAQQFINSIESETLELLRDRVKELEHSLEKAMAGNLTYYGVTCQNKELPSDYLEVYCMAKKSSMSAVQFKHFVDLLILKSKYAACDYLMRFEIYEEYQG